MVPRLRHVDQMRAIAVLFMVEVHTAAILPPQGISEGHPMAFVAAAFGGMAAPMFVTLSGWGIYKSGLKRHTLLEKKWLKWILPRFILLFICQILVNLALNIDRGGRFYWHTPGVLTLLALATILTPLIITISTRLRSLMMIIMILSPIFLGEYNGMNWSWDHRVGSIDFFDWMQRLFWNGTYPLIPWLSYIFLGSLIYDFKNNLHSRDRLIKIGLLITILTFLISILQKRAWALTSGDAVLTFFPASTSFLIVSGTMVLIIMKILEGEEPRGGLSRFENKLSSLEAVGKITLTIYVLHFLVLGAAAFVMDGRPRLDIITAFSITILHTLSWIPFANWHQKNISNISFENLLRKIS